MKRWRWRCWPPRRGCAGTCWAGDGRVTVVDGGGPRLDVAVGVLGVVLQRDGLAGGRPGVEEEVVDREGEGHEGVGGVVGQLVGSAGGDADVPAVDGVVDQLEDG